MQKSVRGPGTRLPHERLAQMLRVNLAGEYGARRIYEGQIAALKNHSCVSLLEHMKEQEIAHLKRFEACVVAHHVRPTILQPFWHVAGYALGLATGYLGEKAAMACTVAVEEVIDEHYDNQLEELGDTDPELTQLISECQEDEREHRDLALGYNPGYPVLSSAIKTASRLAIWLSERL